jgi:hypothetical protein
LLFKLVDVRNDRAVGPISSTDMLGNQSAIFRIDESGGVLIELHGLRNLFILGYVQWQAQMVTARIGAYR